jgi:hypothetical protein
MFCSVAARLWLRAVSAEDWFGNITAVVMPAATTPPTATMRVRIYSNKCANLSHSQCGNE